MSGSPAHCTAALAGVNKNTDVYSFHRLRAIIAYQIEQRFHEVFSGEIDASYFGGYRKSNRGKGTGGTGEKVAIFGLLKRGDKMYTKIIRDAPGGDINADHLA